MLNQMLFAFSAVKVQLYLKLGQNTAVFLSTINVYSPSFIHKTTKEREILLINLC